MFQVLPLHAADFQPLYGLSDDALRTAGVVARTADGPGFPCRVSLRDAEPGERVLLLNHQHQPADTPFRASHAIFVREGAAQAQLAPGELPQVFKGRTLSLRAFDTDGMMVAAELAGGEDADAVIVRLLARPDTGCLHAHFAAWGCFAARVERA